MCAYDANCLRLESRCCVSSACAYVLVLNTVNSSGRYDMLAVHLVHLLQHDAACTWHGSDNCVGLHARMMQIACVWTHVAV